MAEIRRYPWFRHLRSEPSFHVLRHRGGRLVGSGRGLSFFFHPMRTSVAEVPVDDRDLPFLFHGRSQDFQDVTVQGVITYRVVEPEKLADRVDFTLDLRVGHYKKQPLEQIATLLTGLAQEIAARHLVREPVRQLVAAGLERIQESIEAGLRENETLAGMGIEVLSARVLDGRPTSELEQALQTPTREGLLQKADEASFERRALAVEKERAIAENELENQIELARREEQLIERRGQNERRRAEEEAEARRIEVEAKAQRTRVDSEARAGSIRAVESARVEAEKARMEIYRGLPPTVFYGLAARELASKLETIEHLNVTPDLLGPVLTRLVEAGARHLDGKE